ncbi:MAG TPA: hypothetical protein PKK51_04655, partial [Rhodocyclaceae bacterium]|nr:hypothetical protein [Rhodocyclaceae bacterium]
EPVPKGVSRGQKISAGQGKICHISQQGEVVRVLIEKSLQSSKTGGLSVGLLRGYGRERHDDTARMATR